MDQQRCREHPVGRGLLLALGTVAAASLTLTGCGSDEKEDLPGSERTGKQREGGDFGSAGRVSANFSGSWPKGTMRVKVDKPRETRPDEPPAPDTYRTEVRFKDRSPGPGRWETEPKPQTVTVAAEGPTDIHFAFPQDPGKPAIAAHHVCATLTGYPEEICGDVPSPGGGAPASPGGGPAPAPPAPPPGPPGGTPAPPQPEVPQPEVNPPDQSDVP
ncbi:hypothetical protein [Streptomyces sp. NPDC053048]|uniref:hypothetical protein n=1 Tax=Streptomyces sp. NPDC053048 TaxID=3365694 RepID=UPI0037CDAB2C